MHPGTANNITSFSWHPTHENRLLTIALSGTITDYVVFERITINCSPNTEIVWTHGRWILKLINDKVAVFNSLDDILVIFKRRALNDYGLKVSNMFLMTNNTTYPSIYTTLFNMAYQYDMFKVFSVFMSLLYELAHILYSRIIHKYLLSLIAFKCFSLSCGRMVI